ncbi:hypothetical protein GCM10020256_55120 [Streptomyces thermocoprophilus]
MPQAHTRGAGNCANAPHRPAVNNETARTPKGARGTAHKGVTGTPVAKGAAGNCAERRHRHPGAQGHPNGPPGTVPPRPRCHRGCGDGSPRHGTPRRQETP